MTPEQCKAWVLERYPDARIKIDQDGCYRVVIPDVGDSVSTRGEDLVWMDAYWSIREYMSRVAFHIRSEIARLGTPENPRIRVLWMNTLHDICEKRSGIPRNKLGQPVVSDFDKWIATDEEIIAAWKKIEGKI